MGKNAFGHLLQLRELDLRENGLISISQLDSAISLPVIGSINLMGNKLESLPEQELKDLIATASQTLHHVELDRNPIQCDCQVAGYKPWLTIKLGFFRSNTHQSIRALIIFTTSSSPNCSNAFQTES